MTQKEKEILVRALNLFINSQSYMVGKVEAKLKLTIHKNIEIAENLKWKFEKEK